MTAAASLDLGLVPPHRLGQLLGAARTRLGIGLDDVQARVNGRFAAADLAAVEAGQRWLSDEELRELSAAYDVGVGDLVPQRSQLIIDLEEGRIRIGRDGKRFDPDSSARHVLLRYLALITALRTGGNAGLHLRDDDVYTLGTALRTGPGLVRRELEHLLTTSPREVEVLSGSLARRIAMPALGLLVAVTAAGGLLLVKAATDDPPADAPSARTSATPGHVVALAPAVSVTRR